MAHQLCNAAIHWEYFQARDSILHSRNPCQQRLLCYRDVSIPLAWWNSLQGKRFFIEVEQEIAVQRIQRLHSVATCIYHAINEISHTMDAIDSDTPCDESTATPSLGLRPLHGPACIRCGRWAWIFAVEVVLVSEGVLVTVVTVLDHGAHHATALCHRDVPMVWRHERINVNLPHADELEARKKLMWAAQEVEKVAMEATPFKLGITANPPQRLNYYDKDAADGILAKMYIVAVSKVREETSQIEASLIRGFSEKYTGLYKNVAPGGGGSCRMKGPPLYNHVIAQA
jgi:hypothetical protein